MTDLREALAQLADGVEQVLSEPPFDALISTAHLSYRLKVAREALAAMPVEPEAWEWRVAFRTHFGEIGHSVGAGGSGLTEATAQRVCGPGCWIERRRAPGKWERVDPEPREVTSDDG